MTPRANQGPLGTVAFICIIHAGLFYQQTATEKHKMNIPETMNEFLDMSDDEGMSMSG